MKKLLLFALICCSMTTLAQVEQGYRMVGGLLDVDLPFDDDDKVFNLSFSPSYGVFIFDKFAVGANIGLDYTKINDIKSTDFFLGPFTRYYLLGQESLKMFAHAEVSYLLQKIDENSENGVRLFIGPGISYFITDNISADFLLGYNYKSFGGEKTSSNLRLIAGFQIFL